LNNAEKIVGKKEQKKYNITLLTLAPNKVQAYLQTCDFGFLLRENSTVNKIASPVKFLEYTANGVIPIISTNVGDYSADVTKNNIGICLKSNYQLDQKLMITVNSFIKDNSVFQRLYSYSEKFKWEVLILKK
jgi:glycosyltransferase involved in cell wall biosynthesis